jgi:hypothetical protein
MKKTSLLLILLINSFFVLSQAELQGWLKTCPGGGHEYGSKIIVDAKDSIYILLGFSGTIDADPSNQQRNITSLNNFSAGIQKLTPEGELVWFKHISSTFNVNEASFSRSQDGDLFITGRFKDTLIFEPSSEHIILTSEKYYSAFVICIDRFGSYKWGKSIENNHNEEGVNIFCTKQNEVILIGNSKDNGYAERYDENNKIFINKYSIDGLELWTKEIAGFDNIAVTSSNFNETSIVLAGIFKGNGQVNTTNGVKHLSAQGDQGVFVLSMNLDGDIEWISAIRSSKFTVVKSITSLNKNQLILTGSYNDTLRFEAKKELNLVSEGSSDIFIAKLNTIGEFISSTSIGGEGMESGTDIVFTHSGYSYLVGYFEGDFKLNANDVISSNGNLEVDAFILKLYPDFNIEWGYRLGGKWQDIIHDITINEREDVFLTGCFQDQISFDFIDGVTTFKEKSGDDMFILKFKEK